MVDLAKMLIETSFKLESVTNALASSTEAVSLKAPLAERLAEGTTYLIPGLVVVLGLLAMLALCVEFMVWLENKRNARLKAKEEIAAPPPAGEDAAPAEEGGEDFSAEIAVAVGLALHQHLVAQRLAMGVGSASGRSGSVSWASSGRIEIMNARQRVTSRGKQLK